MARSARGVRRWVPLLLACLGFLVLLNSGTARAASADDERARVHFATAHAYFEDGRYDDAAREFGEAYQLSGRPEMLVNKARSQERAADVPGAIATLELLLERYPKTSYRAEAEQQLAKLRAEQPAGALTPPPELLPQTEPEPLPVAEPAPAEEQRKLWPPRWPTLAVGGAAVASVVIAVATGVAAHSKYSDLDDRCPGGACEAGFEGDRDRGQRLGRTSTGFTFAAIALGGVTAALWILDVRNERGRAQLGVRSSVASCEANLRLTF